MKIALAAAIGAALTCIVTGASFVLVPIAALLTQGIWWISEGAADLKWRPIQDAAALMKGTCPSCRTFNCLEEVTSADRNIRVAQCHNCRERYLITHQNGTLRAERVGKVAE